MFNIKKVFFLILFSAFTLGFCRAQDGSNAFSFLNITSSAKIYGMGGVNISSVDAGILSIDQNPALLGPEYEKNIGIGYMRYFNESNFGSVAFGNAIKSHSAWKVGLKFFGYGAIQRTDVSGEVLGDFSPIDLVADFTYAVDINDCLRGGVALKSIYSSYDEYNSFSLAVDLGINYYNSEKDLSLSATVVNLGGQLKRFDQRYERLPIDLRLGWTQSFPSFPVRFSVTAWNLTKWNVPVADFDWDESQLKTKKSFFNNLFRHLVFAADIIPSSQFYLSLGYNYKVRTDFSSYYRNFLSGISLGAGLKVSDWEISLAYAQPYRGANTVMLNISTSLNQFLK